MIIGVDASSISSGGGITFLVEFLKAKVWHENPNLQVIVWAHPSLSKALEGVPFPLVKKLVPILVPGDAFGRFLWSSLRMRHVATNEKVDVIMAAGGNFLGHSTIPSVTMVINQLSFDPPSRQLFSWFSIFRWKLELLSLVQQLSLALSTAAVFFSQFSLDELRTNKIRRIPQYKIIPLGLESRFLVPAGKIDLNKKKGITLLYVSTIFPYKHQETVIEAVRRLRAEGHALKLVLVGDGPTEYRRRLKKILHSIVDSDSWIDWKGAVKFGTMPEVYRSADIFIYASSCEAFGSTLLEAMASGIPIAASNRGPMQELIGNHGAYFNPYDPASIQSALSEILSSENEKLEKNIQATQTRAKKFTWENTAQELVSFLVKIGKAGR